MSRIRPQSKQARLALAAILIAGFFGLAYLARGLATVPEVKIGYFHGGRNALLYRAYLGGNFDQSGVRVSLWTKDLSATAYTTVPSKSEVSYSPTYGRVSGSELIEQMTAGSFDGATVGEGSFIEAVSSGSRITAVLKLGGDTEDTSSRAIVLRQGLAVKNATDLKGRTWGLRRAGPGERALFLSFLKNAGVNPATEATIIDNIPDDEMASYFQSGKIDGAMVHVMSLSSLVSSKLATFYKKVDWVDPKIPQALLIFRQEFVADHPERVAAVVKGYIARQKLERGMTEEEKAKTEANLPPLVDTPGLQYPQFDYPPRVELTPLSEMQQLMVQGGVIGKSVDLSNFVDDSFVDSATDHVK